MELPDGPLTAERSARGMLPSPVEELRTSLSNPAVWSLPRGPFLNGRKQFETSAEQSLVLPSGAIWGKSAVEEKAVLPSYSPEGGPVAGEGSQLDEERKERMPNIARAGSFLRSVEGADLVIIDESGSFGGMTPLKRNELWSKGTFHAARNRAVRLQRKISPSDEVGFEFLGDVLPDRDASTSFEKADHPAELSGGTDSVRSVGPLERDGGTQESLPDMSVSSADDGATERNDRERNGLQHGPFLVKDKGPSADELDWAYFASVRQLERYRQHTDAFLASQGSVPGAPDSGSGMRTDGSEMQADGSGRPDAPESGSGIQTDGSGRPDAQESGSGRQADGSGRLEPTKGSKGSAAGE